MKREEIEVSIMIICYNMKSVESIVELFKDFESVVAKRP